MLIDFITAKFKNAFLYKHKLERTKRLKLVKKYKRKLRAEQFEPEVFKHKIYNNNDLCFF